MPPPAPAAPFHLVLPLLTHGGSPHFLLSHDTPIFEMFCGPLLPARNPDSFAWRSVFQRHVVSGCFAQLQCLFTSQLLSWRALTHTPCRVCTFICNMVERACGTEGAGGPRVIDLSRSCLAASQFSQEAATVPFVSSRNSVHTCTHTHTHSHTQISHTNSSIPCTLGFQPAFPQEMANFLDIEN